MADLENLSRDDWEALLHAPFAAYSVVAAADEAATEAQFRQLRDEIGAGADAFPDGTIGRELADAVAENLDILWSAYRASGRSPRDTLKRAAKGLRGLPDAESIAVRDWLLVVALRVARANRTMGEATVTHEEVAALVELAGWLDRPVPDILEG